MPVPRIYVKCILPNLRSFGGWERAPLPSQARSRFRMAENATDRLGRDAPGHFCLRHQAAGSVRTVGRSLYCLEEGLQAGDRAADDESVHVVCALVGVDGFEVRCMPHDMILG